ncbi:MAG: GUN4 domain-containing protein [Cyanobacteriota bacterium]|nr:GUN4 domain-containing protein [Cyanobacteriota bacterium]
MAKVALLIGVSEYQSKSENELQPLPSAANDIEAMAEVLSDPNRGGFDRVTPLSNPSRQEMEEAIYDLFAYRQKDDLVLFYFSGHGVVDARGRFFLATPEIHQGKRGDVVFHTAVEASTLQRQMTDSSSMRQVVILDCCFSGAFAKGMTVKGEGMANLQAQLGGKGRAILTSSNSTQESFASEDSQLSVYTRYLVEGLKTGAADLNDDGRIDAEELHDYASEKVQEASPAMTPKFYPVEDGSRIFLARSPQDDPTLKYRKAVQELVNEDEGDIDVLQGEIDFLNRCYLDELQQKLRIAAEMAADIEREVMEPLWQRQEKLKKYEAVLAKAIQQRGGALREREWRKLKRFQEVLELRDEDVEPMTAQMAARIVPEVVSEILPEPEVPPKPKPTPKSQAEPLASEIELKSEKGADYTQLRDLLAAQKWKEADKETARVMLQVANREEEGYLNRNAIDNFPCEDLRTIDRLWVHYSNSHFGFSIQKRKWVKLGGKVDGETERKLGDRLGWRKAGEWVNYYELNFSLEAPVGHLPCGWGGSSFKTYMAARSAVFSRAKTCEV